TRALIAGLLIAAVSWAGSAMAHSVPLFLALLAPSALGLGFCTPSLVSLVSAAAGKHAHGRRQGAPRALQSLRRALGPVWGNGLLQVAGEGAAYGSAAVVLLATAALTRQYRAPGGSHARARAEGAERAENPTRIL